MAEEKALDRLLRRLDHAKDIGLHEGMRLLPTPAVSAMGARLAMLGSHFRLRSKVERSTRALSHLRPELDEAARRDLALLNLRNIGRTFAEFSCLHRMWDEGRITVVGRENITAPNAVLALLHLGNWEAGMGAIRGIGLRVRSIYQPPVNQTQLAIAMRVRRSLDNDAIPGNAMAMREALRVLARGDTMIGLFVDEFKGGRVNAPAFGRPPAPGGNIAMAARLAARAGVPLVPAYMLRDGETARFTANFLPPITLGGDARADQAAIEAVIEPVVRRHLEQWLMLYAFRPDR
jgi:KDO2-lipid IV(A) lauroyltransferase